ncbi:hypothetical protein [Rheinheimera texasensis]|uniref:hypothetical protein n=1 Tax=Rheinheimera texasensis TaxID=306205 RepID=UPI0032B299E2
MKTIFKKTLVAAALTAAAFNASAVNLSTTVAVNVSQEGAVNQTNIDVPQINAAAGAEYTTGDTITLTFAGAELDTAASVPAMAVSFGGNGDGATVGFVSATANSVTFRITTTTDGADADALVAFNGVATFQATGLKFKTASVVDAAGAIKVTHSAANVTGTLVIDNLGTKEATVVNVISQFASSVTTKLDGVINVAKSRQIFVDAAGADVANDVLVITPTEAAAAVHDANFDSVAYKITGDFSFADTNKDGTVSAGELAAAVVVTTADEGAAGAAGDDTISVGTLNAAKTEYSFTVTDVTDGPVATTVQFNAPGVSATKPVLVPGAFTVASTIGYTPATGAATSKVVSADAGAWTLNGATVQVPYLVFGTVGGKAYNTIVQLNNASTVSGDVYVDVYKEDGTSVLSNKKVATVAGQTTTNIAGAIKTELAAAGAADGKFSVKVVANVPEKTASVYSAFVDTVTGERIIVNNDSKVQVK